jgi:AGCS family alanine or glycine:cation symporter
MFESILNPISNIVWGPLMLVLLFGVGLYLTLGLRFLPWRRIPFAFLLLWRGRKSDTTSEGDITPFQALMTALSATVGTGNIAGVGTAIALGGPGAIFWMWLTALIGMATKYAEAVLAVHFREVDQHGLHVGGPMYYIKNGLGEKARWLGFLFALFGMLAGFGIGNMVQSNSVADVLQTHFSLPSWITGLVLAIIAAAVILGGIKRLGQVTAKLVPLMAIFYVLGSLLVIVLNINEVPAAFGTIFSHAFNGTAATGGFAGAAVWAAIRFGVARGVFSNEAGLGSAPIAHAAAQTNNPVQQGTIAMLGTFIDTLIVCTMTALVIILTGAWTQIDPSTGNAFSGAALSTTAFNSGISGFGGTVVGFGLVVFAFSTILGWSYYSERCAEFIFGERIILPFRLVWIIAVFIGAIGKLSLIWLLADVLNGLMAIPNLIALGLLSPLVFRLTHNALKKS